MLVSTVHFLQHEWKHSHCNVNDKDFLVSSPIFYIDVVNSKCPEKILWSQTTDNKYKLRIMFFIFSLPQNLMIIYSGVGRHVK